MAVIVSLNTVFKVSLCYYCCQKKMSEVLGNGQVTNALYISKKRKPKVCHKGQRWLELIRSTQITNEHARGIHFVMGIIYKKKLYKYLYQIHHTGPGAEQNFAGEELLKI